MRFWGREDSLIEFHWSRFTSRCNELTECRWSRQVAGAETKRNEAWISRPCWECNRSRNRKFWDWFWVVVCWFDGLMLDCCEWLLFLFLSSGVSTLKKMNIVEIIWWMGWLTRKSMKIVYWLLFSQIHVLTDFQNKKIAIESFRWPEDALCKFFIQFTEVRSVAPWSLSKRTFVSWKFVLLLHSRRFVLLLRRFSARGFSFRGNSSCCFTHGGSFCCSVVSQQENFRLLPRRTWIVSQVEYIHRFQRKDFTLWRSYFVYSRIPTSNLLETGSLAGVS